MAPVYDVDGNTFTFRDQRLLMIEMDKFVAIGNQYLFTS